MRTIELTNSHNVVVVDEEDYEELCDTKWHENFQGYAMGAVRVLGQKKKKLIAMHRLINKTPKGLVTDHINHDKLDNRKSNLRTTTSTGNNRNRKQVGNQWEKYTCVDFSMTVKMDFMKKLRKLAKDNKQTIRGQVVSLIEVAIKQQEKA